MSTHKRIAVASSGAELNSKLSDLAARAPYFLIFTGDGEIYDTIKNPFSLGGGGAGFSVARILSEKDVTDFICTKSGGNLERAFKDENIKIHFVNSEVLVKDSLKLI
jgi:predicted Fe-Mo cluster-binding NifX family protein